MPGVPPTLKVTYNNSQTTVQLTRRRFLSSMFAYLTALCVLITVSSITALAVADPLKQALPVVFHLPARLTFSVIYVTFIVQMISITMWGLYYLGERMHTPDSQL